MRKAIDGDMVVGIPRQEGSHSGVGPFCLSKSAVAEALKTHSDRTDVASSILSSIPVARFHRFRLGIMNKLALETLQQIFQQACADGGYTGCSLSLTSKSIRIAARSVRFHSVSLTSQIDSVCAFLRLYEKECLNAAALDQ